MNQPIEKNNPCGLDGFAFLEFSSPTPDLLHTQFKQMGFQLSAKHHSAEIFLYQQGEIQFIVNATTATQAAEHAKVHGSGACAMGFNVSDASKAYDYAISQGAQPFTDDAHANHFLPAIQAIGGSVIYFIDNKHSVFGENLKSISMEKTISSHLTYIDHLTHNVFRGNMDKWAAFYKSLFNFHEIRFFNIEGQQTGLLSRALSSPCGKIKIPLNESKDDVSQIEEFLQAYHGEGIQHIALGSENIYESVNQLRSEGIAFLDVPDTYYEMIQDRVPWHKEPLSRLQQERILIDGGLTPEKGLLLQIFTENLFGPVFFELIQRHGNEGFGEGNFQALFEAIERDQIKRGILSEKTKVGVSE